MAVIARRQQSAGRAPASGIQQRRAGAARSSRVPDARPDRAAASTPGRARSASSSKRPSHTCGWPGVGRSIGASPPRTNSPGLAHDHRSPARPSARAPPRLATNRSPAPQAPPRRLRAPGRPRQRLPARGAGRAAICSRRRAAGRARRCKQAAPVRHPAPGLRARRPASARQGRVGRPPARRCSPCGQGARGPGRGRGADRHWPGLRSSPGPGPSARRAGRPGAGPAAGGTGTDPAPPARPARRSTRAAAPTGSPEPRITAFSSWSSRVWPTSTTGAAHPRAASAISRWRAVRAAADTPVAGLSPPSAGRETPRPGGAAVASGLPGPVRRFAACRP